MSGDAEVLVRNLDDSYVLITGGTSGIGFASAQKFAESGTPKIAINGRNEERGMVALDKLRKSWPKTEFKLVLADVTIASEVTKMVNEVTETFGRIDVLVSTAGGNFPPVLFHKLPIDEIQEVFDGFALGSMLCASAVLPGMSAQRGGVIISVGSDAGKVPTPGETVIGAAMAAISMFTRGLSMEAKRNGVRVNCLSPSLVRNTRTWDLVFEAEFSKKLFAKAEAMANLGITDPEDQAEMVVYMASPAAARMTGQSISVNGGISA